MPTNALDNPLVLPILGLLVERSRHPYAVFSELRRRYDYLQVRNGTVYTLLQRLTDEGWVSASGDERIATESGVAALAERVAQQLRSSDLTGGPAFVTALAYIGILPPSEAVAVLEERVALIHEEIQRLDQAVHNSGEPEIHMIEAYFLRSRLKHDVDWLDSTARRIKVKELGWVR